MILIFIERYTFSVSNHTYTKKIDGDSIDFVLIFQVERKIVMTTINLFITWNPNWLITSVILIQSIVSSVTNYNYTNCNSNEYSLHLPTNSFNLSSQLTQHLFQLSTSQFFITDIFQIFLSWAGYNWEKSYPLILSRGE